MTVSSSNSITNKMKKKYMFKPMLNKLLAFGKVKCQYSFFRALCFCIFIVIQVDIPNVYQYKSSSVDKELFVKKSWGCFSLCDLIKMKPVTNNCLFRRTKFKIYGEQTGKSELLVEKQVKKLTKAKNIECEAKQFKIK